MRLARSRSLVVVGAGPAGLGAALEAARAGLPCTLIDEAEHLRGQIYRPPPREFHIPDMVCEGCAEKIAAALNSMPGVREVKSKVSQKLVHVSYEPAKVQEQQLKDAVNKVGFTALAA
jgi:copper chaperone CopZ